MNTDNRVDENKDYLMKADWVNAMSNLGEAHNLLAKTNLPTNVYQPISSLLAGAKVSLFNLNREWQKQQPAQVVLNNELSDKAAIYLEEMNIIGMLTAKM